ncbi:MAG: WD40 repeat domain-containing protein [Planctomycetota bacterium]
MHAFFLAPFLLGSLDASTGVDGAQEEQDKAWAVDVAAAEAADVVVIAASDGTLRMVQARTGGPCADRPEPLPHAGAWAVDVAPGGDVVAILDRDGDVHLWRWRGDDGVKQVAHVDASESGAGERGHRFGAFLAFSSTGQRLAVGVAEGGAVLLDLEGNELASVESLGGTWFDAPLAWSRNGARLAALTSDGPVVMNARNGQRLDATYAFEIESPRSIALDAKGERVSVGGCPVRVQTFDAASGELLWTGEIDGESMDFPLLPSEKVSVAGIAYSPDDRRLACTTAETSYGAVLDARTGDFLGVGQWHGGRMGEPRTITWVPGEDAFFHNYASGGMPLARLEFARDGERWSVTEEAPERAATPDAGLEGIGVHAVGYDVRAFDLVSGQKLWRLEL